MAKTKIKSVNEFLDQVKDNKKSVSGEIIPNKFNKKRFNEFLNILINDPDYLLEFVSKVQNVNDEDVIVTDVLNVSEQMRTWIKSIVEKVGVDKNESAIIMDSQFKIPAGDLYEFVAAALYLFLKAGNKFDMIKTPTFTATLSLKNTAENVAERDSFNPQTKEKIGRFKITTKAHETLVVKNTTPKWLKDRKLVKNK